MSCFRFGMCMNGLCWCSADECEARNLTKLSFNMVLADAEMQGVITLEWRDGDPAVWLKRRE